MLTHKPPADRHALTLVAESFTVSGEGSCKLCSCPSFIPAAGEGKTCINHNAEGGTCNHRKTEHN